MDDPLPRNPAQKRTKFKQIRTRLNKANKATITQEIERILLNPEYDLYREVSIRGIQGRVYHCKDTNLIVGIHTEGEFAGQIMKAQPITPEQLEMLKDLKSIQ